MTPTLTGMDDLDANLGSVIGRAATATRIGEAMQTRRERTTMANHVREMREAVADANKNPSKTTRQRARAAGDRARQAVAGNRRFTPPKGRR